MIRGIHHVAIHTSRFDEMVKFYREAFGFEPNGPELSWSASPLIDRIIGVKDSAARVLMLKAVGFQRMESSLTTRTHT